MIPLNWQKVALRQGELSLRRSCHLPINVSIASHQGGSPRRRPEDHMHAIHSPPRSILQVLQEFGCAPSSAKSTGSSADGKVERSARRGWNRDGADAERRPNETQTEEKKKVREKQKRSPESGLNARPDDEIL